MITSEQLKFYKTDHTAEGKNSIGGDIDLGYEITAGLNNIFDEVYGVEAAEGSLEYRAIAVKNTNTGQDLYNSVVFLQAQSSSGDTEIAIGIENDLVQNTAVEELTSEKIAPTKVLEWIVGTGDSNGIKLGDISADGYYIIWVRRSVNPGAEPMAEDEFTIAITGDTL